MMLQHTTRQADPLMLGLVGVSVLQHKFPLLYNRNWDYNWIRDNQDFNDIRNWNKNFKHQAQNL